MVTSSDVSEYVQQERSSPLETKEASSSPTASLSNHTTSPEYPAYSPALTRTSTNTTLSPDSFFPEVQACIEQ